MPLFWILFGLVTSAWPRWQASRRARVAHLGGPLSARQAFTAGEHAALVTGVLCGLALGNREFTRLADDCQRRTLPRRTAAH